MIRVFYKKPGEGFSSKGFLFIFLFSLMRKEKKENHVVCTVREENINYLQIVSIFVEVRGREKHLFRRL